MVLCRLVCAKVKITPISNQLIILLKYHITNETLICLWFFLFFRSTQSIRMSSKWAHISLWLPFKIEIFSKLFHYIGIKNTDFSSNFNWFFLPQHCTIILRLSFFYCKHHHHHHCCCWWWWWWLLFLVLLLFRFSCLIQTNPIKVNQTKESNFTSFYYDLFASDDANVKVELFTKSDL